MPPLFGLGELARRCCLSRPVLLRLLRRHRVEFVRSGRAVFITAYELEAKIPTLWASFATVALYSAARPR